MDASTPKTKKQILVKVASSPKTVGLWRSSKGEKIFRAYSVKDLLDFASKTKGLHTIDLVVEVFENPAFFEVLRASQIIRVQVPSLSLENLLPPWASTLAPKLPSLAQAYPPDKTVYPPLNQVFSGLWFDPKTLKVLIIGQDPYHGPGQAHGLAFSCRESKTFPPSLINIYKELCDEGIYEELPKSGDLTPWFKQGVALINTSFTVIRSQAGSLAKEWDVFSKALFELLAKETSSNLVVLAWGNPAGKRAVVFEKAKILRSSHPSPLGVNSTSNPFCRNKHFRQVNDYLRIKGLGPIDWSLE